jgi:phosphohistidine swiveling domain-containing protein
MRPGTSESPDGKIQYLPYRGISPEIIGHLSNPKTVHWAKAQSSSLCYTLAGGKMAEYVVPLASVGIADAPQVGTKAAVLGALKQAWFPVPPGLCLTTAAFRLAFESRWEQISAVLQQHDVRDPHVAALAAQTLDRLFVDLEIPKAVMKALDDSLPTFADPATPLAVRSSATAEDTSAASFAGHYHSAIGVCGRNALQAAILDVWRSFFNPVALHTRAALGNLYAPEGMAILVLPMINAECAGVCFSVDPVHNRRNRVLITSAWGLGVGVVDGSVACDTAWVRRDGATEGFELEEQHIVEQAHEIRLGPAGDLMRLPVPENRRRAVSTPDAWLERIAQFGVAAEVLFRHPQDLEWAIADGQVWVLQSRPITALPPELSRTPKFPVNWKDEQERRLAWIHYPYWRYVLKPLEIEYAYDREAASIESCLYRGGERYERAKVVNGHLYTCWARTDQLAGDRRIRRAAMADLAERLRQQDITPWEHWGPEIIKATQRLGAFDPNHADGAQLAEHLEDARGAFRHHFSIHGSRLYIAHDPLYSAFATMTGMAESAVRETVDQLLEGEETISTRLIDGLHALACTARKDPTVSALVANPPPDVLDHLAQLPQAAEMHAQLEGFLNTFGDRSGVGYGWDGTICTPTWRENLAQVLHFVAPYLDPTVEPPALARERARKKRDARIEELTPESHDPAAVADLVRQLAYARRAEAVVEEHNHYIDQLMNGQLRRAILYAASWLVERGTLATQDDVFWLHYDEILSALRAEAPTSVAHIVSQRQAQHAEWQNLEAPPLLGTPDAALPQRPPLRDAITPPQLQRSDEIRGLAASPGCRRGRARVIPNTMQLPDIEPGEVLVAENVAPRWTPLIPMLGGMVLDGGAVGQHHAIIAREYGVPAVVGTRNATRRIVSGAWVTVNGTAGIVTVETQQQE